MTAQVIKQVEQIDSLYFGEEDVMSVQSKLIELGYINPDPEYDQHDELATDPVLLAKALDRLVDSLIAGIIEYPEEMLFGGCDGNYRAEFERGLKALLAERKRTC